MYKIILTLLLLVLGIGCLNSARKEESYANLVRTGNPTVSGESSYQDTVVLHKALGEKYYSDRQYDMAINQFSLAIKMAPGDAAAYEGLARSHREIGEFDKALAAIERGLSIIPPTPQNSPVLARFHNTKAVTYDTMENHKEALLEYDKAIKLNPNSSAYYTNKGFSCLLGMNASSKRMDKLFLLEQAITAFKKAIEINPNNKTAHGNLGYAYGLKGMYELALSEFKLASDEASAYNDLGFIYTANGKLAEALESYNNALKINPNTPAIYYNIGKTYELLGDFDSAINSYREFLKYTTNTSSAEEAFKKIQELKKKQEKMKSSPD